MSEAEKAANQEKFNRLQEVIVAHRQQSGALMPVLQEAQNIFGFLPMEVQNAVAEGLGLALTEVYGVATFYSQFSLKPKGMNKIGLCMGTACYVRNAQKVMDALTDELKIQVGDTTDDRLFTLEATRCLGCCGLAPVMMINDDVYGSLTPEEIPFILEKYQQLENKD